MENRIKHKWLLSLLREPKRFRKDVDSIFIKCNTKLPPYLPLPRFILRSELSLNAKLLYGLLLNRTTLSQEHQWTDEQGNVYVIYTVQQMAADLDRSKRTVQNALNDLDCAGLILRVRQGWNRANRIFVLLPDVVKFSAPPECKDIPSTMQDTSLCEAQDLPTSKTDTEYQNKENEKRERDALSGLGSYQNVFLSAEQLSKLRQDFPGQADAYIEKLSAYMKQHGKNYADHAVTLRKWLNEDQNTGTAYNYDYVYKEGECL